MKDIIVVTGGARVRTFFMEVILTLSYPDIF